MDIPDKAVEAAAKAEYKHHGPSWHTVTWETDDPTYKEHLRMAAERMLGAAAPFIAAQEVFRIETQAPHLTYAQLEWLARRREELESK